MRLARHLRNPTTTQAEYRQIKHATLIRHTMLADDDIGDPIGGPLEQYESVAKEIETALARWLDEVKI